MRMTRRLLRALALSATIVVATISAGCISQTEIPLAKVPPAPEGFGKIQAGTARSGASPDVRPDVH